MNFDEFEKEFNFKKVLSAKTLFIMAVVSLIITSFDIGGMLLMIFWSATPILFFLSIIALGHERREKMKEGKNVGSVNWKLSLTLILITIVVVAILAIVVKNVINYRDSTMVINLIGHF